MIEVPPLDFNIMERSDTNLPRGALTWPDIVVDMARLRQAIDPDWVLEEWIIAQTLMAIKLLDESQNATSSSILGWFTSGSASNPPKFRNLKKASVTLRF